MKLAERIRAMSMAVVLASCSLGQQAAALTIVPTFGASITSQPNAASIEADVAYASRYMDWLYTNSVIVPITFQLAPLGFGATAESSYSVGTFSLPGYANALATDSNANPSNGILDVANVYLRDGNGANGSSVLLNSVEANMLSQYGLADPYSWGPNTITLNSDVSWTFAGLVNPCVGTGQCRAAVGSIPLQSGSYDANQALFHEMDEILGGGGAGSTLNECLKVGGQYCDEYGTTDLFRWSVSTGPSYSTTGNAQAYLSFNGGLTNAIEQGVLLNNPAPGLDAGDFNDGAIDCTSYSALIQGFSCAGTIPESYTTSSPEFRMMSMIGWDHNPTVCRTCPVLRSLNDQNPITGLAAPASVSEPGAIWLFLGGMGLILVSQTKRKGMRAMNLRRRGSSARPTDYRS